MVVIAAAIIIIIINIIIIITIIIISQIHRRHQKQQCHPTGIQPHANLIITRPPVHDLENGCDLFHLRCGRND